MRKFLAGFIAAFAVLFLLGSVTQNGQVISTSQIDIDRLTAEFDGKARWFGLHASPSGEVTRMDNPVSAASAFQLDAGNDTWGAWVQIVGSSDTPVSAGHTKFDIHKLTITATERASTAHLIQVGCDTSGANALTNDNYVEVLYISASAAGRESSIEFHGPEWDNGTKCWARVWADGQNTGTLDFYFGLHEYE